MWHFNGKFAIFWTPDFDRISYTTNTVNERPSSICISIGNFICENLGVTMQQIYTRDRNGPISLPLSCFEFYPCLSSRPTPRLLKIGKIRENGKTWKKTNLQNRFWSLERGKILSLAQGSCHADEI